MQNTTPVQPIFIWLLNDIASDDPSTYYFVGPFEDTDAVAAWTAEYVQDTTCDDWQVVQGHPHLAKILAPHDAATMFDSAAREEDDAG